MSQTAGVKPMSIAGRVYHERERCIGMTDAERTWRRKWLKDQILTAHEPVYVPEYWKERINPIRRFYRAPLDMVFNSLQGVLGKKRAIDLRYITGKVFLLGLAVEGIHYYLKYGGNDWTKKGGWRVLKTRPATLPGQAGFPASSDRVEPGDYANRGFKNSPL